ncbi:hypothetical protein GS982_00100 [Rhodococcus hoagii]|uniref:Uncharacterized protein n=1 Tax=Rhodococcus hoagii TaxID=43767 RepID=A0A9Q5EXS7_RHOHA|nr:hypothetical protein [Prescottella equi]MBM4480802.1 hypothetical protein [Prescottella equi]MBM4516243.1 hypothetical protein [Prescottella equi]MBM4567437.1 hypothetical protein [Prescottella equi]MBM4581358.1 hypothetical protein [Prescottella equi]MBM4585721.1 hypothetical protein [Prescottella equi]
MTLTADDCLAAEVAIHRTWLHHADKALRELIALGAPFSADQLRAFIPEGVEPHHPNAIGPFFRAAEAAGRIQHTGQYVRSSRGPRHGSTNRLWTRGDNA